MLDREDGIEILSVIRELQFCETRGGNCYRRTQPATEQFQSCFMFLMVSLRPERMAGPDIGGQGRKLKANPNISPNPDP